MKHPLCALEDVPEQGSKVLPFFGREVHVYRDHGAPRAVINMCLHLGGPLDFKDGKFVCPWHGAEFATSGGCLKGPAPAQSRLMVLPTRIEEGNLVYVWGE